MQKILLTIDPQHINTRSIDFACFLANKTMSKLTGVFLENVIYEEMSEMANASSKNNEFFSSEERNKKTDEHIGYFREACEKCGAIADIHRKRGAPADEMIEESRFADLIIVDPEISFRKKMENIPSEFVRELLAASECPVIISPQRFESIDEIIFTYNASSSSVFAIKQFTYLFPEFRDKKISLLEVNKVDEISVRSKPRISQWLKTHYRDVDFTLLSGEPQEELFKYLFEKKNALVVMGAYGRGVLSSLFSPSRAKLLVRTADLPIFITHH